MASRGGAGSVRVSRDICSVCLESFRGRQPKLLPCFHTFCLKCLIQLETKARENAEKVSAHADESSTKEETEDIFITCPTCRTDVQVPPEGVSKFQTNFYLDQEGDQGHVQPIMCDLCDQGQVASHWCTQCQMKLCFHCHRGHGNCLQPSATAKSTVTSESEMAKLMKMGKTQMEVISKVLSLSAEEEKELHKQKKALEDSLHDLYTAGLARLSDARDDILRRIRSHTESREEKLTTERSNMQKKYDALVHFTSQVDTNPITMADLKAVLMPDSELTQLQSRAEEKAVQFFRLKASDRDTDFLVNSLQELVFGTLELIPATQDAIVHPTDSGDLSSYFLFGDGTQQTPSQPQQNCSVQQENTENIAVLSKVESLAKKMEFTLKKVRETEGKEKQLQGEIRYLMEEVSTFRDKNALLLQDVATIQAENIKLKEDILQLQRTQQNHSQLNTADLKQSAEGASNTADLPQGANWLQTEVAAKESTSLKTEVETVHRETTSLNTRVQASADQIFQLQQQVRSLQNTMWNKVDRAQIRILESRIGKAVSPIYFKAELDRKITVNTSRPLICKAVLVNEGDGYDDHTGMFSAPVSGTYLFLVTVGPSHDDKIAEIDIIFEEDECMGYACCDSCNSSASANCVVKLDAGEKVWLRTESGPHSFDKGGVTSFSGILIMPEL